MTWYEWGMCVDRIESIYKRRNQDYEFQLSLQRHMMALIANVNGNKTTSEDFLQPNEPDEVKEKKKISEEELKEKLKNRRKKNG